MYLKTLEVQGFKSFADRTVIHFDTDITAIVGPNGAGKSNISDAIRWVMGEMSSRELRGSRMEDVIFGGTQTRPAVGFAEATLTLDNSDGAFHLDTPEIMITRRYYRSGESEYYINKQSARLRDINELFMDTGLGKEGYSNIGQGRIDEIVSLKSTDRREIFEEAAGISKYRHRKEESERRLANTEENLLRIGDKISELELQVDPLRDQAEKAKKYLAYRDELKGLEVTVWLSNLEKLAEAAKKAEADYNSAAFILEQQHGDLNRLYAEAEQYNLQLNQMTLTAEEKREAVTTAENVLREGQSEIAVIQGDIRNRQENLARLQAETEDQEKRRSSVDEEIRQQQERMEQIRIQLDDLRRELETALEAAESASRSGGDLEQELTRMQAQSALLLSSISEKKLEIASISASVGEVLRRKRILVEDRAAAESRRTETKEQADACGKRLEDARETAVSAENTIQGYQLRRQTRQERRQTLQKEYDALQIRGNTLNSKIQMYREMQRDYDGYSKSVKTVMQSAEKGVLHGVFGPVSDLIRTDDRYTVAIETALGAAMQNIVVKDRETAKAAIRMLKQSDGGRATFAPLDAVHPRDLLEKGLKASRGFVGVASDLVQCEQQYADVVKYLLGRTVISEDLDTASAMAKQFDSRFKIVTLDGQVMNAGGTMTGGSASKSAGILSRANALGRMEKELADLNGKMESCARELQEAVRAAEEVEFQLEAEQSRLRQAQDSVLQLAGEKKQYELLLQAIEDTIASYEQELSSIHDKSGGDEARLKTLEDLIRQDQTRSEEIQAKIEELSVQQSQIGEQNDTARERVNDLKLRLAAGDAEREAAAENTARLQTLAEQIRGDRAQKETLAEQYQSEIRDLEDTLRE